jgi:hypothetical protein
MRTAYHIVSTSNFEELQHANIAGYDLAYNKMRKMKKTIKSEDGTTQTVDFTVLTLVYKMRNWARAYMNHYTNGENFTTMVQITGSYKASAKGMKNSYALIKQYLSSPNLV